MESAQVHPSAEGDVGRVHVGCVPPFLLGVTFNLCTRACA